MSIGPIKVSHFWKGLVVVFFTSSLLRRKNKRLFIYKPLFLIALLQLVNVEIFYSPINAIISFGTISIIPLFGFYILRFPFDKLKMALLFFTSFFILCFVPYELGFIESIEKGYDLEVYGSNIFGIIGPFQTVHSASMTLGGAFLVTLYFILDRTFNRLYLWFLLILCFYFLFNTYVRTGMAMVAIGSIPLIIYFGKKQLSTRIRLFFIGGLLVLMVSTWVLSNEVLLNRIKGETERVDETESLETVGSGRGALWTYALEVYYESSLLEKFFGIGQTQTLDRIYKKAYNRLFPHNGFLQILLVNGLIGLLSLLYFIKKVYGLRKKLVGEHNVLVTSLLYAFIVMSFFQNYELFYFHILFMLTITMFIQKSYYLIKAKTALSAVDIVFTSN